MQEQDHEQYDEDNYDTEESLDTLGNLRTMEAEGRKKTISCVATYLNDTVTMKSFSNSIKDILTEGAKEFEERTGRAMTYPEMRAIYG